MKSPWLCGHQQIADYIGVYVDTARRYERQYNMPVHRLPGGRVRALDYELDRWLILMNKHANNRVKAGKRKKK